MELARGFAGEVEYAVEVTGTELAEGELEQDASFTETGWGFEKYCGMALEGGGEFDGRGFLTGARRGESGTVMKLPESGSGAKTEVEKFSETLKLYADEIFVGRIKR